MEKPLALKLAPKSLKEVYGQQHLVGKDKVLTHLEELLDQDNNDNLETL